MTLTAKYVNKIMTQIFRISRYLIVIHDVLMFINIVQIYTLFQIKHPATHRTLVHLTRSRRM